LWNLLCRITGQGISREGDLRELTAHVHGIQRAVMKQAAARAYPDRYRLLGDVVHPFIDTDDVIDTPRVSTRQPKPPADTSWIRSNRGPR